MNSTKLTDIWQAIQDEAAIESLNEPVLASFYHACIITHKSYACALAFQLASKLDARDVQAMMLRDVIETALKADEKILSASVADIQAYRSRDPACDKFMMPFLYFKGFHAIQAQRVANFLWHHGRKTLALYLQTRAASVFTVDIHPAVQIGSGIMLDHATGFVAGETATIGDNVSILHQVTLGGTGTATGARHPQIGDGAMLAAGATLLGPIQIGAGAKVAAGSLVLESVPALATVAGVPARIVGRAQSSAAEDMNQQLE